jgi:hypothetical protein
VQDFSENFLTKLGGKGMNLMWFLFGGICWILWLNRNDFIFKKLLIS